MDVRKIKDGYRASGVDFDEFIRVNNEMAEATKTVTCRGADLTFLSLDETGAKAAPGSVVLDTVNYTYLEQFRNGEAKLPFGMAAVKVADLGEEILKELEDSSRLVITLNRQIYVVSEMAMATFCMQASLGGDMMINNHGLIRNMMLADSMIAKNSPVTMVYREATNEYGITVRKVFAVLGKTYKLIPQTVVQKIKDAVEADGDLGAVKPGEWGVDHDFTSLNVTFPALGAELAKEYGAIKVMPGVQIYDSDTGCSSIIVRGTYQTEKSYVITDEVAKKHTTGLNLEEFLADVKKSIFENFRALPEILAQLIGEPVYGGTDEARRLQEMKDVYDRMRGIFHV